MPSALLISRIAFISLFPGPRVSFDKVHKSVLINRLRDQKPLYVAAAALQDRFKLILRLHSLGDHLYADRSCQSSYAFEKIEMFFRTVDPFDETPVDLYEIYWEVFKVREGRITCPEIIYGDHYALFSDHLQLFYKVEVRQRQDSVIPRPALSLGRPGIQFSVSFPQSCSVRTAAMRH